MKILGLHNSGYYDQYQKYRHGDTDKFPHINTSIILSSVVEGNDRAPRAGFNTFNASTASIRTPDMGMPMKKEIHLANYTIRTCTSTLPAGYAQPGVEADVPCSVVPQSVTADFCPIAHFITRMFLLMIRDHDLAKYLVGKARLQFH
jgi:hypothetical protein